ncbi:MAG TPA: zinc ribbon domain-containing protein [Candidatus Limnocylindria bacterium]|nr:zinc ribbon domain-containing protein [Candidatus Limnocylindria bacterium]
MTGESVECFNCGRQNPPWAHVCRFCGVPLRPATEPPRSVPSGIFPTDRRSLLSMGAAVGTILAAIVVGLIVSNLNPVEPRVGLASPTPRASVATPAPSIQPVASEPPAPTPTATPALAGTLTFGTERNKKTCEIGGQTDTFAPGTTFAHAIGMPEAFGVSSVIEEIAQVGADGKEKVVQSKKDGETQVSSKQKVSCYAVSANNLIRAWGPGSYVMRVFRGEEKIAEGRFKLTQ